MVMYVGYIILYNIDLIYFIYKVQNVSVGGNVGQAKIRHISDMSERDIVKIVKT